MPELDTTELRALANELYGDWTDWSPTEAHGHGDEVAAAADTIDALRDQLERQRVLFAHSVSEPERLGLQRDFVPAERLAAAEAERDERHAAYENAVEVANAEKRRRLAAEAERDTLRDRLRHVEHWTVPEAIRTWKKERDRAEAAEAERDALRRIIAEARRLLSDEPPHDAGGSGWAYQLDMLDALLFPPSEQPDT